MLRTKSIDDLKPLLADDFKMLEQFPPVAPQILLTVINSLAKAGSVKRRKAKVREMEIGELKFKKIQTVFSDISHFKASMNTDFDGLIG